MEFYRTSNRDYGTNWVSTQGGDPRKTTTQVGTYRTVAETDKFQKVGLKLLKTKIMLEKEEEDID